jgi:hypothetical protein
VPAAALTVERARTVTLPTWNRPAKATAEQKAERIARSRLETPATAGDAAESATPANGNKD